MMKIKVSVTLSLLLAMCCMVNFTEAQSENNRPFDIVAEFQAYPTGLIPGLRFEKFFTSKNALHLRVGYNWVRHGDAGVHDDERGEGLGFTLGFKRYLRTGFTGLYGAVRNDLWWNKMDWKDHEGNNETSGKTEILVVQPTLEAGWQFELGRRLVMAPSLAVGYEVNVRTEGEPTGEGAIFLAGLNAGLRF